MSVAGYSTCRIQFISNDQQHSERNYSDRSVVELRQRDFADYIIRALDIENNKAEIFNIQFKGEDQYTRGRSANEPDEIRAKNGRYNLWLNATSRNNFHEALDTCTQELQCLQPEPPQGPTSPPRENIRRNNEEPKPRTRPPSPSRENIRRNNEESKPTTRPDRNNILVDVYQLGQHIRQGNVDEAVDVAKKLGKQRVQLQANPWRQQREEEPIQIKVKIDGNDHKINSKHDDLVMAVYPSTTVRELRSAFEHSHNFPPLNQYFFVNGHLAHETSTMTNLNVHSNSLFVLFLIQQ